MRPEFSIAALMAGTQPVAFSMNPTQFQETIPPALRKELQAWSGRAFERRTIIVRDDASKAWVLLGCTIRPLQIDAPPSNLRFEYDEQAVLIADCVHGSDLRVFFSDAVKKLSELAEQDIASEFWPGCQREPVALDNYWMERPGVVYTWRPKVQPNPPHSPMLVASAPYYPDVREAARDWLQLRQHAGHGDGGIMVLLLPETRAVIQQHNWADDDEHLRLQLAGSEVSAGKVLVKGAYWCDKEIRQLHEGLAADASVTLAIPREADRLELFLLGKDGTVYEHHKEALGSLGESRFLGSRHRMSSSRIEEALRQGEGVRVEFKEFVDLPKPKEPLKEKDKLNQVLRTVAAFSNSEGGTIFIGVSNDIRVVGIRDGLVRWAGSAAHDSVEKYVGSLRSHLRDEMQLPVDLSVSVFEHQQKHVVLVEVPPSRTLVSVKGDGRLFKRVGASNKSVPPEEWTPRKQDLLLT